MANRARQILLRALVGCALVGCSAITDGEEGQTPASQATGSASMDPAARSQVALETVSEDGAPGCAAAVGQEGKPVWQGVSGVADRRTGAKITQETVFDIGSVSKQFTATSVLLLASRGQLSLRDRVSEHVSGMPAWATTVSLDQLMHQTSGIPDYLELMLTQRHQLSDRTTEQQSLRSLATVRRLDFAPGTQWHYSNSNYLLLRAVVEAVSGQSLARFLSTEVFSPLDLDMVADSVSDVPGKAVSYERDGMDFIPVDAKWDVVGQGGIQTTAVQLVLGGQLPYGRGGWTGAVEGSAGGARSRRGRGHRALRRRTLGGRGLKPDPRRRVGGVPQPVPGQPRRPYDNRPDLQPGQRRPAAADEHPGRHLGVIVGGRSTCREPGRRRA